MVIIPKKKDKSIVMNQRRYSVTKGLWSQYQNKKEKSIVMNKRRYSITKEWWSQYQRRKKNQ